MSRRFRSRILLLWVGLISILIISKNQMKIHHDHHQQQQQHVAQTVSPLHSFFQENDFPSSSSSSSSDSNQRRVIEFVIMAGPKKTATTSIERNLWKWSLDNHHQLQKQQHANSNHTTKPMTWYWAQPPAKCLLLVLSHNNKGQKFTYREASRLDPQMAFQPVLPCLSGKKDCFATKLFYKNSSIKECKRFLSCYQDTLYKALWQNQDPNDHPLHVQPPYNTMVLSLKSTVEIINARQFDSYLYPFLQLLTSHHSHTTSSNRKETRREIHNQFRFHFVFNYRVPRINHLISLWHERRDQQDVLQAYNQTIPSLRTFLVQEHSRILTLIDALGATYTLVQLDPYFHVTIMDTSGIQDQQRDVTLVFACDLLEDCQRNRTQVEVYNKKSDEGGNDLTDEEMSQLDEILQRLDCNVGSSILNHPRIQILYPKLLIANVHKCPKHTSFYSYEEAKRDIERVVERMVG